MTRSRVGPSDSAWTSGTGTKTREAEPARQVGQAAGLSTNLRLAEAGVVEVIVVDAQDRFGLQINHEWGKYIGSCGRQVLPNYGAYRRVLLSSDDDTTILPPLGNITSRREQKEKAWPHPLEGRKKNSERGNYPGGRPPYGIDVVCFDASGHEKYRVVWEGHRTRLKISGKVKERFDGKDNVPAKNLTDTLKYRPTVIKERLKWVKLMFKWVDEEGLSPKGVADRLNTLGVSPVFGKMWYKQIVKPLLMNPIYIGFPADNEKGGSRFYEYVNGQVQEVENPKASRRRDQSDWWRCPDQHFEPIIAPELFNRVQQKLRDSAEKYRNPSRRPPRTAQMWLKGILVCGRCGMVMHANASDKGSNVPSYFCSTYNRYGNNNPTGCRCHRVRAEVVEKIVQQYVEETHERIAKLMKAADKRDTSLLEPVVGELDASRRELLGIFMKMASQIQKIGGKGGVVLRVNRHGATLDVPSLPEYRKFLKDARPQLEKRRVELDAEHDRMLDRLTALPTGSLAVEKVTRRIEELEKEMRAIAEDSENAMESLQVVLERFQRQKSVVQELVEKIGDDAAYVRKRELLQEVVSKIVLHFDYRDTRPQIDPRASWIGSKSIQSREGNQPVSVSEARWRQIDHHAILRPLKAGVHQRPLDPCVLSLTAISGRPTSTTLGSPAGETSTSTSTGRASMPSMEKVLSLASMVSPHGLRASYHLLGPPKRGYDLQWSVFNMPAGSNSRLKSADSWSADHHVL